ncbi:MAG TPA: amidohydrolase [bacterium]|nr:amidohydrolase [bacterium]
MITYRKSPGMIVMILLVYFIGTGMIQAREDEDYQQIIEGNTWVDSTSGEMTPAKKQAMAWLEDHQPLGREVATYIWHHPELGLGEHLSSEILQDFLERSGFEVEAGVADQETGFVATWGAGEPVIGFHAEFDALPGLSQVAGQPEQQAITEEAPGHGCGHNLFGTYSSMAAVAVKEALREEGIRGTVKVYGTPAEETLVGKAFFVKYGIYADADVVISWHPSGDNRVVYSSSLAMDNFKVRFTGIAAHAASDPWEGRSALDAVELMSVGMNYMREHIRPTSRIMSSITNGGRAPNVVPPKAEVWYYVRAPHYDYVTELMDWTRQMAEAAAMMSQTEMEFLKITGVWEYLPNNVLARVGNRNVQLIGPPAWTEEDQAAGKPLSGTKDVTEPPYYSDQTEHPDLDAPFEWASSGGSIDEANTSWVVPMVRFVSATKPKGVPGHSWQQVAGNCLPQAFKGALTAAKYMATTALDLYLNPELVEAAWEEHQQSTELYGPFADPVEDLPVPTFQLMHGMQENEVPKQWEDEPYSYPELLEQYRLEE